MIKRPTLYLVVLSVACATTTAFQSCILTTCPRATTKSLLAAVPTSDISRSKLLHGPKRIRKSTPNHSLSRKLSASNDDNDNDNDKADDQDKIAKKVAGRKKRVMIGYRLSAAIYALLGISTLIPAFIRPEMAPLSLNYAGGPMLAAGFAYILAGAAENDRLGSDTYKRMNLMFAKFGFLWLLAGILVKQTQPLTRGAKILSNPLVMLASLSALVNGIKGWGYGVKGWDKSARTSYKDDLVQLLKSSAKVFTSPLKNMKAGFYLGATAFSGVLKVTKLVDLLQLCSVIGSSAVTAAKFGSWSIAYAKIVLLATAVFTLTDAAKRDRLEGTTFIELNVLSAFTWLGMGAFMFHSGQILMATLSTFFSSCSLLSGVSSYLKKKEGAK